MKPEDMDDRELLRQVKLGTHIASQLAEDCEEIALRRMAAGREAEALHSELLLAIADAADNMPKQLVTFLRRKLGQFLAAPTPKCDHDCHETLPERKHYSECSAAHLDIKDKE